MGAATWTVTPVPTAGQLLDTAGKPVAGAVVTEHASLVSPAGRVLSDALGRYSIGSRRWPYTPQQLSVEAPGFAPLATSGGRTIMHRWPRLSGRVVDDGGTALVGAVVTVAYHSGVIAAFMTNLDGRFETVLPNVVGDLSVTAQIEEHDPATGQIAVALDQSPELRLALPRQFAKLHLDSDPAGQAPQIDDQPASDCQSTPCDLSLLAGAHRISFVTDLFVPWQTDVSVSKNDQITVHAQLERKMGTLTVAAPNGGELSIDGQLVDARPFSDKVPTGRHLVGWRSPGTWPTTSQVDVKWNETANVSLTPAAVAGDPNGFANGLRDYLNAQGGGTYGVYMEGLRTGASVSLGDTTSMEAASVIKMPVALYLLKQSDTGKLVFSDQIDLHPEDFMSGTGNLNGSASPGDKYSYDQLLSLMIQQSDNTAWRALRRVLGDSQIDAMAASIGAGDCHQSTNICSARSAGRLMAQLARGQLLNQDSTQRLLNLLETTVFNDWLPYYVGRGATVAHKIGTDPDNGVANDCGVVFLPSDPFAICIFTTAPGQSGVQVIRDIARAALNLY